MHPIISLNIPDTGPLQHVHTKPSIAVVSPFVDKRHGTERGVCEWLSRLAKEFDIHLYSQRVEDLDTAAIHSHHIPRIRGPHLINYLWWFAANHLWRWYDKNVKELHHDLVFSPGINCMDADVVSVHIVFGELYEQKRRALSLRYGSLWSWPRIIHRRLYYRLIMRLERRIYASSNRSIVPISSKTAADLERLHGRCKEFPFLYPGIDPLVFSPATRAKRRKAMREQIGITERDFVVLLIGNDWHNKGLPVLIESVQFLKNMPIVLVVVGKDDPRQFREMVQTYHLENKVHCLPTRADVIAYYALADIYAGPSLVDAFSQPITEAMACGLPVIASANAGASEIITHGIDGLVLEHPTDVNELASLIGYLYHDPEARRRIGEAGVTTMQRYTWDQSAFRLRNIFRQVLDVRMANNNMRIQGAS